ncbi:MAG: hypothetical protein ACM3Y9_07480 [Ignavibacteria bacterium]
MQVSIAQSPLSQSFLAMYQQPAASSNGAAAGPAKTIADAAPQADTETVTLHTDIGSLTLHASLQAGPVQAPEVFAEIWKDGVKIGSVYTDGRAVMPSISAGVVAGISGSAVPYIQAEQISRMVGGEVRYVDMPALHVANTRNQLRAAYGA